MSAPFILDQTFSKQDYSKIKLSIGEYENCVFEDCNFSDGYLHNQNFVDCQFIDCNLSNTNISNTTFNEVTFTSCKLIGLKFETVNPYLIGLTFEDCNLELASFYGMELHRQLFKDCNLSKADFTDSIYRSANSINAILITPCFRIPT